MTGGELVPIPSRAQIGRFLAASVREPEAGWAGSPPATLAEIRRWAVERVARDGESPEAVVRALGVHRWVIHEWLGRYRQGGMAALQDQPVRFCPSQQGPRRGSGWAA